MSREICLRKSMGVGIFISNIRTVTGPRMLVFVSTSPHKKSPATVGPPRSCPPASSREC